MKFDDLEDRMRTLEVYHQARVLPQAWPILRVDGRTFSKLTEKHFDKPFDERFHQAMVEAAGRLLEEFHGLYAYTESDEISLLLARDSRLFDREQEKLVSLAAAIVTSSLTLSFQRPLACDARLCVAANAELVVDYFQWRQSDATRCCLNGWCYWKLRQAGLSKAEATRALHGRGFSEKNELLFQQGVNFNDLPLWQRRGTGLYWETYTRPGRNPLTGQTTDAVRRRLKRDENLPMGADYGAFLRGLIGLSL